ncbi:hypothetical protein DFP72DRAFT_1048460 [Ephemerocybe angulata]|uniref:C2H2-type domain-containing protein n=1 Tax=Ephemerocybe angulata TaxID=980116 RepID=A0A8H6HP41_9AGAR|nr:hypothetical protein DFP72DRAFT_1048460 [Tulosesus angulatus]
MRFSILSLLPIALALASFTNAHVDRDHSLSAREYLDELSVVASLERRELLEDLTTRELIDELSDRLERREQLFKCPYTNVGCTKVFNTWQLMEAHVQYHFNEGHPRPEAAAQRPRTPSPPRKAAKAGRR